MSAGCVTKLLEGWRQNQTAGYENMLGFFHDLQQIFRVFVCNTQAGLTLGN
jgi:hypothetical protein